MARIRTIKPEFPQSQSMGRVSRDARLLFVLLWTIADDSGRTRAASRMLASLLFPYDDDAPKKIDGWLNELEVEKCIVLYRVDGDDYLEVCNWASHQRIDHASPSKFPPRGDAREDSCSPRESSCLDQGPRTKDQGGKRAAAREPLTDPKSETPSRPEDVPEQVWADWLAHRRRKRATVTQTAIEGIQREAKAAEMTLAAALEHSIAQGWQGFRADWVKGNAGKATNANGRPVIAASRIHMQNMPLGSPTCECAECVSFRSRKAQ